MGLTFTKLFARLFSKKEMRILMVSGRGRGLAGWEGGRGRVPWGGGGDVSLAQGEGGA